MVTNVQIKCRAEEYYQRVAAIADRLDNGTVRDLSKVWSNRWEEARRQLHREFFDRCKKNSAKSVRQMSDELGWSGPGRVSAFRNGSFSLREYDKFVDRYGDGVKEPTRADRLAEAYMATMKHLQEEVHLGVTYELDREAYEYVRRLNANKAWLAAIVKPQKLNEMQSILSGIQPQIVAVVGELKYTTLRDVEAIFVQWGPYELNCSEEVGWRRN